MLADVLGSMAHIGCSVVAKKREGCEGQLYIDSERESELSCSGDTTMQRAGLGAAKGPITLLQPTVGLMCSM